MNHGKIVHIILALSLMMSLEACALSGGPVSGRVLEEGTKAPIVGAYVSVCWTGYVSSMVDATTVEFHAALARTDEQGRFHIPAWKKDPVHPWQENIRGISPSFKVYFPGYTYSDSETIVEKGTFLLKRDTSPPSARFERIMTSTHPCLGAGQSNRSLYPLDEALYQEAKPLAVTKREHEKLQLLREIAASDKLSVDQDRSEAKERQLVQEYLRDHLK